MWEISMAQKNKKTGKFQLGYHTKKQFPFWGIAPEGYMVDKSHYPIPNKWISIEPTHIINHETNEIKSLTETLYLVGKVKVKGRKFNSLRELKGAI